MSDEGWVNAEILDNPSGEPPEPQEPEEAVAAEGEAIPEESLEQAEPASEVDQTEREKAGILKELRETRDSMKRERIENAERNRVLEERLAKLFEARKEHEREAAPDPEEDPLGHLSYQQKQQQQMLAQMAEQTQLSQRQTQEQQQLAQFAQSVQAQEESFRTQKGLDEKTYESALDFARNEVKSYYSAMGYSEQEAEQIAQIEQTQFAAGAIQRGVNPAEARYNMAIARGFKAEKPEGATPENVTGAAERFQFKKDAVKSSKSLSSVSGTQGKGRITLEDLANAPHDLFDKIRTDEELWEKINVEGSLVL